MLALLSKELKSVFCSVAGLFFSVAFLLISGLFLWFFSGRYNIPDGGYADLNPFFSLAPVILIVLIPALTMRLFAEEKRNGMFAMLRSFPVRMGSVWFSKFLASFLLILLTLAATIIYVVSISQLANPVGNIDLNSAIVSYLSLLVLSAVFLAIGLFASAITSNQIVALILGIVLCAFSFYGFDLVGGLFSSGKVQALISSAGLADHYTMMQRGVLKFRSISIVCIYLFLFYKLALASLKSESMRMVYLNIIYISILGVVVIFANARVDLTSDKRYTLSDYTKGLLAKIGEEDENVRINIYLDGDFNMGFLRLKEATKELLDDINSESNKKVNYSFYNPYKIYNSPEETYKHMQERGMPGISLNEVDREGKLSRKIIYPYAQVINNTDTLVVPLLKNVQGYTAEENLNASIENLEYEFIDALRLLRQQEPQSVAFIEGHGELPREYVFDAEELLSKYYSVHRGQIGNQTGILDDFDVVVIAGPGQRYSEQEKYVLDQYIMSGGRVLWLVDGAYTPVNEIFEKGSAASMKLDANLDDMLFTYGVRMNADFVQDMQCTSIMLVPGNDVSRTVEVPYYYMPLLIPSQDHIITRNIRDVKTSFASSIGFVGNSSDVRKTVLLTTSAKTRLIDVPATITMDAADIQETPDYFNQSYIPVAATVEGVFNSVYQNRLAPQGIDAGQNKTAEKSVPTKMVVVSSSNIIANGWEGKGEDTRILPMGYDRISKQQFGNREFIVNAVNWLTGDDQLMALRTKQRQMYLLNKSMVYEERDKYAALNIGLPILFMLIIIGGVSFYRKRKYER